MTWNYRVVRHVQPGELDYLEIHEVYYDENGNPNGRTKRGATVGSETIEGIVWVLDRIKEALEKPILNHQDFGKAPK